MRRKLGIAGLLIGAAAWPSVAGASGDYGCAASWTLTAPGSDCANRIVIGPGNDTRANLLLLLRDRAGLDGQELAYPSDEWLVADQGRTFFEWGQLVATLYPAPEGGDDYADNGEFQGSRCQSVKAGGEQFLAAVERNRRIGAGDRESLAKGRIELLRLCQGTAGYSAGGAAAAEISLPHTFASPQAREFGTYLAGAAAFYAGDWRGGRERFASLRTAKDEWVRETALYMLARNALGEAAASGITEWGDFDTDAADKELAQRADAALEAYVKAYPDGRYTASATGLTRRAQWFGGTLGKQGAAYARKLASIDAGTLAAVDLIEEIDDKFLLRQQAGKAIEDPWLLATHDLMRMRTSLETDEEDTSHWMRHETPLLTAEELAGQAPAFANNPDLYAFLKANYAFYIDRDYRAVLQLLPDDARRPEYTPLQFSRQALRGMALAELGDRNEAGFWQELLRGAKGVYQRPTAELGLALNWERNGQVATILGAGSPIEDERIRSIVLAHSAGPDVLRAVAQATSRSQRERDLALFVLLYKQLARGSYAAAVRDLSLVGPGASTEGWFFWDVSEAAEIPVGMFTRGQFSDGYACPALPETVARLARNADDVKGRLCLGDFYRLNGFDELDLDDAQAAGELGSFAEYPGEPIPRSQLYASVIAEPGVSRDDRAYALYRAVQCYAPVGNSSCGGENVPPEQRRAWFRRLKGEFANTRWGREAEYYW